MNSNTQKRGSTAGKIKRQKERDRPLETKREAERAKEEQRYR